MNIAIIGGTGFLGTQLAEYLLSNTNDYIRIVSRNASRMAVKPEYTHRMETIDADIMNVDTMTTALQSIDVVYYFVHLMGHKNKDFYTQEAIAAEKFSVAAIAADIKRVIFMGGLGNDTDNLSPHLASRHNTGGILRKNLPLVIEFRASMVIGNGSVAYDIVRGLVKRMPVMPLPRGTKSRTQPIALRDALEYLALAATLPVTTHQIIEIGGPEVLTYQEFYKRYAHWTGRHPIIVRVPFLPEWLGGLGLDLFTPKNHAKIGRVMVNSMVNDMVVTDNNAIALFPTVKPRTIEQAFDEAKKVEKVA